MREIIIKASKVGCRAIDLLINGNVEKVDFKQA